MNAAEKLVTVLTCSVHRVVTEVVDHVPCSKNERVLYAVQLTQSDLDLIVVALRRIALQ